VAPQEPVVLIFSAILDPLSGSVEQLIDHLCNTEAVDPPLREFKPRWRRHDLGLIRQLCGDAAADKLDVFSPIRRVLPSMLS
jgi:hypothetical protein